MAQGDDFVRKYCSHVHYSPIITAKAVRSLIVAILFCSRLQYHLFDFLSNLLGFGLQMTVHLGIRVKGTVQRVLQTAKDILTFRRHTFPHKQTFKPIELVIFQPVVIMFLLYEGYGGALYCRRNNIVARP